MRRRFKLCSAAVPSLLAGAPHGYRITWWSDGFLVLCRHQCRVVASIPPGRIRGTGDEGDNNRLGARRRRFLPHRASSFSIPLTDVAVHWVAQITLHRHLSLLVTCASQRGVALSVDAASFHAGPALQLDGSLFELEELSQQYGGPLLHQRHLADHATGMGPSADSMAVVAGRPYVSFFHYLSPFHHSATSFASRMGHLPVHTIPSRLYDSLIEFLAVFGIDDAMAAYLHQAVMLLQKEERQRWTKNIQELLNAPTWRRRREESGTPPET